MRVTQNMLYSDMLYNMNQLLGDYIESNEQAASQKRVNRPSDDPIGTINILNYRASIEATTQYLDNSEDAASWLASTDSSLAQTQVILARLSELAEQAATGTMTPENRIQISFEVRELYEQLINVANTQFGGQHLFSGHKTNSPAFDQVLGVTSYGTELEDVEFSVDGELDQTAIVRFSGSASGAANGTIDMATGANEDLNYEYSLDGGESWIQGTMAAGSTSLDVGGAIVDFADSPNPVDINFFDPDGEISPLNGTVFYVRPSAIYRGDDSDPPPDVEIYGDSNLSNAKAEGVFNRDVQIRIDEDVNMTTAGTLKYSYSTDNGTTWQNSTIAISGTETQLRFIVPNGYVDVDVAGDLSAGQQMIVRPDRADDIGYEIAENEFLDVTISGKDIFGGLYQSKHDDYAKIVDGVNMFESIGKFIGALETNNSDQIGQALEDIEASSEHLLTQLARVGGKENRVSLNISILQARYDDESNRMSAIEDIDMTKLMLDLSRQETAYETVLKSSSMIMGMTLMDYL